MPDFRRYFVRGGTYFFTVVSAGRAPLFQSGQARTLLGQVMREQREQAPFETLAIVLMPDHLHALWTLPEGDDDYPNRWKAIKAKFTSRWLEAGGGEQPVSDGYRHQRRRGIWQPRFFEHTIRDEEDLHNHADYIHYNPVKHGWVRCPKHWAWSSFHRFAARGHYPENWGCLDQPPPDFGSLDEGLLE
ncbi:MAG TPA: transposase [Thermoguttaceae bacterium]|nr:transposase [Thermoguttaceae bacterium]